MSLEFQIEGQGGSGRVDANYVVSQLQQAGYNPQGMSADGMTLTLQDAQGPYQVKTTDALKNLGWNVMSMQPGNADYDNVQMGWRAAVNKLPDDDTRRAYIEGQMRKAGVEQPTVAGNGRDWFVFNPASSQWIAVTNRPDWDVSDAVEAGLEAPRAIASALGGAAGAVLGGGLGSLATGAAGAAAGGGGMDFLQRSALAHGYPGLFEGDDVYRQVVGQNLGATAADMGGRMALDAGTQGLFQGLPKLVGSFSPKIQQVTEALTELSPVSRASQATGAGMQLTGGGVAGLAKVVDNPMGRDLAGLVLPISGDLSAGGFIAQGPAYLTGAAVKGMGSAGESEFMRRIAPGAAGWMRRQSDELSRVAPQMRTGLAEETQRVAQGAADAMRGRPASTYGPEPLNRFDPQTVFANLGQKIYNRGSDMMARLRPQMTPLERIMEQRSAGMGGIESLGLGSFERDLARQTMGGAKAMDMGRRFGRLVEDVGDLGRAAASAGSGIAGGAIKTARAAGETTRGMGTGLRALGTVGRPVETRAYARYGTEEALRPELEELNPLRRRRPSYMMGLELAQN